MRVTRLANKTPEGFFHVVGENFMLLRGRYDSRQMWFEFMDRAVFESIPEPEAKPPYTKHHFKTQTYAKIDDKFRQLHPHDHGLREQMVLPFHEAKRVTNRQFIRLKSVGAKTWERKENGDFYEVENRSGENRDDVAAWLTEHCQCRFQMSGNKITFEAAVDAVNAKLKFS